MNAFERHHALKLKAGIAPFIPAGFQDDWASVSAWLWLSPGGKGLGGGAQVYDRLGYAGGFTFDLQPLLRPLVSLRAMHPEFERRPWVTVLLQFAARDEDLKLTYDWNDAYRWAVTPDNYRWLIREMRPDFGRTPPIH